MLEMVGHFCKDIVLAVSHGMVCHGLAMICSGRVWYIWYATVWYGIWYGIVCHGIVWYGTVRYGMAWHGMAWHDVA